MLGRDYSKISLYEVSLCLDYIESNIKNLTQTRDEYIAIWRSLQWIARDLIDPSLMQHYDAKLYYPNMNATIQRIYDILLEKGVVNQ